MMLTIVLGLILFIGLLFVFLFMLPRTSPASDLLHEVAQQATHPRLESVPPAWRSALSADSLAKPFSIFRRFFTTEPDPALVRRLLLAGREPRSEEHTSELQS